MVGDYSVGGAGKASTNAVEDNNPAPAPSRNTDIEPQHHHIQRMETDGRGDAAQ